MDASTAPEMGQIEVSIFGPGKGEAVAVHLGGGDWITIDSCRDQLTRTNAVLNYFKEIGVDVTKDVRLVVATHAHDDHVAGIAELYKTATEAQLVLAPAMTSEEFFAEVIADIDIEDRLRQSVRREYKELLEIAGSRGKFKDGRRPMTRAAEQKILWERAATEALPGARVVSLSPSEEAFERAQRMLAQGAARAGSRRRLAASDPNEYAIALWVEVGNVALLLGADLIIGPSDCGWKAVVDSHHPNMRASLFKVPHHGSPNADHPPAWAKFLSNDVVSLLAPFRGGSNSRPNEADVKRVLAFSGSAFATAKSSFPTPSRDLKKTRAALSGVASNVRDPNGIVGHVRARTADTTWSVETFAPGHQL